MGGVKIPVHSSIASRTSTKVRTVVTLGKPKGVCYKKLSELVRHYMLIEAVLAFLTSGLCLIAFAGGLSFMCGRRGFRPLGDAGLNTAHQMTSINNPSFQQTSMQFSSAKPLAVSHVMPVAPPPGYTYKPQVNEAAPNVASLPQHRQSQSRFLPPLAKSSGSRFRMN